MDTHHPVRRSRSPSDTLHLNTHQSSLRRPSRTNLNQHDSPTATILSQSNSNSISPLHLSPSIIATRQHDPKRDSGGSGSNSHSSNSNSNSNTSTIETTEWRSHTNVYVKGLPERCTTEDLQAWAEQVARPVSVKTIRDAKDHNVCTGLGFVRFNLPAQAKLFIALVNAVHGYEACFAKETYVGKMEKASDPRSANLYLSHIPLSYNEEDILALFPPPTYTVRSLRLLHEGDQPGKRAPPGTPFKGAGFIRLDTRAMAERAVAELNGKRLPGHGRRPGRSILPTGEKHSYVDTLQVRFADTEVQKEIKKTESVKEQLDSAHHQPEVASPGMSRSRKGQAYRRLSFSTEQKIKNNALRKGRKGSNAGHFGPPPPHPSFSDSSSFLPPPPFLRSSSFSSDPSMGFSLPPTLKRFPPTNFQGSFPLPPLPPFPTGYGQAQGRSQSSHSDSQYSFGASLADPMPISSPMSRTISFPYPPLGAPLSRSSFATPSPPPLSVSGSFTNSSASYSPTTPFANLSPQTGLELNDTSTSSSSGYGMPRSGTPFMRRQTLPPLDSFGNNIGSGRGLGLNLSLPMGLGRPAHDNNNKTACNDQFGLSSPPQSHSSSSCYEDDIARGVQALQAQHDQINRSMQNLDRLNTYNNGRRGSEALSTFSDSSTMMNFNLNDTHGGDAVIGGLTSFGRNSLSGSAYGSGGGYGYNHDLNFTSATAASASDAANATGQLYDLSKLVMAPPATPPPDHTYFDTPLHSSAQHNQHHRPTSRNHQRAHTTALTAPAASYAHYDPDYSPSKLLAPLSALARRSSTVEDRIARRRGSQMSLFNSASASGEQAGRGGDQF